MSKPIAEKDRATVVDREAVAADAKSQLFYNHYRGMTGVVAKIYDDGTAAVDIDPITLPETLRARHTEGSEAQRQKWLDGLSDEARNRLSAAEKKFALRYTILVAVTDLIPATGEPQRKSLEALELEEERHLSEIKNKKSA
ncbi:hypothetical protein CCAX7_002270 [Capsulimonas corticalis]|uniref:Uncharacterized protein n=1 Tax=Capsulimonas corticalis TaxID=2219043 RepID=A0A402CS33_9BACT|nr:hypothetical protein [Capsulimonas corticalis]BDI28176.1 hypothetical protein CCAX7_002270 [Capsulimonas corticalis]